MLQAAVTGAATVGHGSIASGYSGPVAQSPDRGERAPVAVGAAAPVIVVLHGYRRFTAAAAGALVREVTVARFPNGELHADVPACVEGRGCVVVGSVSPPGANLERLTLVAHALRRAGASRVTALIPYLAYARQDRARPGESLGLAWLGDLLRASGVDEVAAVDVHSHLAGELLGLPLRSLSPAALLADALPQRWREDVTFVAPDEGAIARCTAIADAVGTRQPVVWARKRRTVLGVEHLGLVGDSGRRALIVDDILDSGATLTLCARALRARGVEEIAAVVTHARFTGQSSRDLVERELHQLWITDTVLRPSRPSQIGVVAVAELLVPILTGVID